MIISNVRHKFSNQIGKRESESDEAIEQTQKTDDARYWLMEKRNLFLICFRFFPNLKRANDYYTMFGCKNSNSKN